MVVMYKRDTVEPLQDKRRNQMILNQICFVISRTKHFWQSKTYEFVADIQAPVVLAVVLLFCDTPIPIDKMKSFW